MARLDIELPFPVSVNEMFPQNRRTGRRFKSRKYAAWQREAQWTIKAARLNKAGLTYPVNVEIVLTPRDRRARDADNFNKGILDALVQSGTLTDDSNAYVRNIFTTWAAPDKTNPRATVTITSILSQAGGLADMQLELEPRGG